MVTSYSISLVPLRSFRKSGTPSRLWIRSSFSSLLTSRSRSLVSYKDCNRWLTTPLQTPLQRTSFLEHDSFIELRSQDLGVTWVTDSRQTLRSTYFFMSLTSQSFSKWENKTYTFVTYVFSHNGLILCIIDEFFVKTFFIFQMFLWIISQNFLYKIKSPLT